MPSEWAKKTAQNVVRPLKDRIYQVLSAENYDHTWDRVAEALDAARIEGLEEAFKLATEHCEHGEFAHYGRFECVDALRVQMRARIEEIKKV